MLGAVVAVAVTALSPGGPAAKEGNYGPVRDVQVTPAPKAAPTPGAVAAGGTLVTIADFAFRSPSITVHAGQTVTWTNAGPSSHTATGNGFDTGVLKKGASASHRFTTAGTFSYVCSIHPQMKGTVRVVAAADPQPAAAPKATTPAPVRTRAPEPGAVRSHAAAPAKAAPELPRTGSDLPAPAVAGVVALAAGLALARRTA
jgi:LPXTG-motif cell wall-anchored protein